MPQTIYRTFHHLAGSAPDTTPRQLDLQPLAMRIDIAIFDFPALVAFSDDGIFFSTEREFPAGVLSSLDQLVQSVRIRNKTVASIARYDINGFYSPVEIVGAPLTTAVRTP
jgi:hypothetical protein